MVARRRQTDATDDDYTRQRNNGHARWIIGVVSLLIIAALGTFASSERARLTKTEALAIETDKQLAVHTASVDLRLETIEHHLEDIAEFVKEERRE